MDEGMQAPHIVFDTDRAGQTIASAGQAAAARALEAVLGGFTGTEEVWNILSGKAQQPTDSTVHPLFNRNQGPLLEAVDTALNMRVFDIADFDGHTNGAINKDPVIQNLLGRNKLEGAARRKAIQERRIAVWAGCLAAYRAQNNSRNESTEGPGEAEAALQDVG